MAANCLLDLIFFWHTGHRFQMMAGNIEGEGELDWWHWAQAHSCLGSESQVWAKPKLRPT